MTKPAIFLSLMTLLIMAYASILSAQSEEYIIGPEDVLQISFWQDPSLDQTVVVRQDGKITLSIIGEITAADQTTKQLATKIEQNVALFNKKISQATVTVVGFNSRKVYVTGRVLNPGKHTFEVIPDLWTVIKEAGGVAESGDLTRVTIIRSEEKGGEVIRVNVLEAVSTGRIDRLPKLESGDTIEIPRMAGNVPGRQLADEYAERKNLIYVLGQVRQPGTHAYEPGSDIYDAIGQAGGMTPAADESRVKIISKNAGGTTVMKVNLKDHNENARARRIVIKPEDTIVIGEKGRKFLSWQVLRDIGAVTAAVTTVILLIDRLD